MAQPTIASTNERIDALEERLDKLEKEVFAPSVLSKVGKTLVDFAVSQKDNIKNIFKSKKSKVKETVEDIKEDLHDLKNQGEAVPNEA